MSPDDNKPKIPKTFNRNAIRMSTMSRLFARHYKTTGSNIEGSSAIGCLRWKKFTSKAAGHAEIAITVKDGSVDARMHDHFTCNNFKFCPHCARAGSAKMREYITQVFIPAAERQGYARALMTLTASHRRDCDWKANYADLFYQAVTLFSRRMGKAYKVIGCPGQFRAMESPVGPNGLHLHIHDELLFRPGADLEAFEVVAVRKWQEACKAVGLYCNSHGLHITTDFDPCYIAKDETQKKAKATAFELAAYDTKTMGHNRTLFDLLDACAKGDIEAGDDYIRTTLALQGRARWNIGQLAKKLGIVAPSAWKQTEGEAADNTPAPAMVIAYPIEDHLIATTPEQKRHSLALILRAARQEMRRPGSVSKMVKALSDEVINTRVQRIRHKYAKRLSKRLDSLWAENIHESIKHTHKKAMLAAECRWMNVALAEYAERNKLLNPAYAQQQREAWAPAREHEYEVVGTSMRTIAPGLELDFA